MTDVELLRRLATAWRTKWNGEWDYAVTSGGFTNSGDGEAHVYRVEPHKILAFGKGTFTHTRHRFDTGPTD